MDDPKLALLGKRILDYCHKYQVPEAYLFSILEDQKVTPMIRGKAMEYNAYLLLLEILPSHSWSVEKLNLNAQPGAYDEDISVTHRRSGVILKIESKSAARGSISTGTRSRTLTCPHFRIKCHRSRSNIELAGGTNDRYSVDCFDVLITNPLNALFERNTVGENLELIHDLPTRQMLFAHYNASTPEALLSACSADWRFCIPTDIAIEGFIPRSPTSKLADDPFWRPIGEIESRLLLLVDLKRAKSQRRR